MPKTLSGLTALFKTHGAVRCYAKALAPNDNSKNQIYLGGDFSALNILPYHKMRADSSKTAGSVRDRAKADLLFFWADESGLFDAPNAQLILYPKYPEVRLSGILNGCAKAPNEVIASRNEGRVLFLGITENGLVLGYAAAPEHPIALEFHNLSGLPEVGVFFELPLSQRGNDSKELLLAKLSEIFKKNWIPSQKLGPGGLPQAYSARNGGGYTLEAQLGIMPNGYAEPDFLGWEIKQYGVWDFTSYRPKSPVTLMTPEPTGGLYQYLGPTEFLHRYGYADKSGKPGRINFGGVYACNKDFHADTGLRLNLAGYNKEKQKITDMSGGIILTSRTGEPAAVWYFDKILEHWNKKHARAAYVPSLHQSPPPEYRYGPRILLCEQTDFTLLLNAVADGVVYYDPGIKMEKRDSGGWEVKRRSQFRIKHEHLKTMYKNNEVVLLK